MDKEISKQILDTYSPKTEAEVKEVVDTPEYNPNTLVKLLGLKSSEDIEEIAEDLIDEVEEVEIGEITDSTGFLSNQIKEVEKKYGNSVNPIELCPILPGVKSLKDHEIIYIEGKQFATGLNHVANPERLENLKAEIRTTLSSGVPFKKSLSCRGSIDGQSFNTIYLNKYEIRQILSAFRRSKARHIRTADCEEFITVGI